MYDQEIKDKCSKMTVEEKAELVNGASFFGTFPINKLGIPRLQFLDGGTGVNYEQLFGDMMEQAMSGVNRTNGMAAQSNLSSVINYFFEPEKLQSESEKQLYIWMKEQVKNRLEGNEYAPACYPAGMALGATWNRECIYNIGVTLGKEARRYKIDVLLGTPNVNIHRAVLNGRLFEGYSEDPCLVAQLAPALVQGVQSQGVAANVKHFAANNQETNRAGINEIISERALEEIYYPGFKACVQEGKVKTVMSAYNSINGVPCTENEHLLTKKLRQDWGFQGVVLSDWGAVKHPVAALNAGNDLAMPGPREKAPIIQGIEEEKLTMEQLNQSVCRILELIMSKKDYDIQEELKIEDLMKETDEAAYKASCESIVLLENEKILPLDKQSIALTGSGAEKLAECGTGSAGIKTNRIGNLKKELMYERIVTNENEAEVIIHIAVWNGMEGNDRNSMQLAFDDLEQLYRMGAIEKEKISESLKKRLQTTKVQIENKPVILVLNVCGPVDLSFLNWQVVKGVLCMFIPGMGAAKALADILNGKVNPSGRMPITFPMRLEDEPAYLNFPGDGYEVCYGEGIYVGYRYYDKKDIKPLYAFGYGLSYTKFHIGKMKNLKVNNDGVSFSVAVSNRGPYDGAEVVQIYLSDPYSTLGKPVKELKAFQKIFLACGEQKTLEFHLSIQDFASYDQNLHEFTVEEGFYDIHVATSSAKEDIKETKRIYMDVKSPYSYGIHSTIKTLYEQKQIYQLLKQLWEKNQWDWQIIESNYEYASNISLELILPEKENEFVKEFIMKVEQIKKY